MNIAVLVSGGGTNFQALLDAASHQKLGGGVIRVCLSSNPKAYALQRAENAGIESVVVQREQYASRREFSNALICALEPYNIDLVVLSGFMCILDGVFLDRYKNAVINVHPSLIPSFCGEGFFGLRVHRAALEYGVRVTGATVHFVTLKTDSGPIILQKPVFVMQNDTPEALQKRVMEQAEWELLPKAVELFCKGKLRIEGRLVKILE